MNMLPQIFAKTNKRGCPYIGVILISVSMFLFAYISDGSSDNVSLDVYGIKLIMDGQQIAQDDNSVSSFNGNYAELNYDIAAGASSSGILVFPAIEQKKDFQVVLSNVISDNYELDFDTYTLNISAQ